MNLVVKKIQAVAIDSDDNDIVLDNSDTTNNDPDFQTEGE